MRRAAVHFIMLRGIYDFGEGIIRGAMKKSTSFYLLFSEKGGLSQSESSLSEKIGALEWGGERGGAKSQKISGISILQAPINPRMIS